MILIFSVSPVAGCGFTEGGRGIGAECRRAPWRRRVRDVPVIRPERGAVGPRCGREWRREGASRWWSPTTWLTRRGAGLAAAAVEAFGRLDIVVNTVGGALRASLHRDTERHLAGGAFEFKCRGAHSLTRPR